MKSTAWKKDYLVVRHNDYDDTWRDLTIPCTFMQAIRFVRAKNLNYALSKDVVRIVTLTEWATLPTSIELTGATA
jgi:hypothetical protein